MSRSVMTLVLIAVVAAAVFLFLGNPFGPKAGDDHGVGTEGQAPGEVGMSGLPRGAGAPAKAADVGLAGSASERGKGDVRVRLLSFKDRTPLVDQPVKMTLREGETFERKTGEDGRVVFHELRANKAWTLTVTGATFSPVEMKGVAVPANGVNDLGDLLLGEKVVLKGRVIDTRGRPIPGAAVSAYVGGGFDMSQGIALAMAQSALDNPLPSDEAQTDVDGVFALAALTPGRPYEIKAKRPGYALSVQADLVVSPDRNAAVLTIVLGEGATVKGKVVDEAGKPVAKATVIAMEDLGMRAMRGGTALKRDYAMTLEDGTFVLDTLTRGARYRFGVSATGYAPLFDTMAGGLTVETEAERNFTLVKGGNIEGRVTDKTTGTGVAGARVLAVVGNLMRFGPGGGGRRGGGFGGGGGAQPAGNPADDEASTQIVLTGEDGSFRIEGLKPGPVALAQVKAPGYGDYSANVFAAMMPGGMGGGGPAPAPWGEVRAGETLSVAVELEAGGSVSGRVMAASGAGTVPVAGAQVSVIQLSMMTMMTGFATTTTADDGSFRVDGIRPGRYTVTATASGFVAPDAMAEGAAVDMPEGGGQVTKDVLMSAAGAIEGTVRDGKGVPVGAARVRTRPAPERGGRGFTGGMLRGALPGGGTRVVLTDADGKYRIDSVPGGEKQLVTAEADEFVPAESEPVEVRVGEVRTVDLVLTGGGTLVGRVIDDRGGIVAGARLRVGHVDADAEAQANLNAWRADAMLEPRVVFSGDDGRFEINRVPPGRTLLKVEKEGYTVFYRRDLLVRADDVLDNQVVTLTKGETISGVVKGEDGKPLAGITVAATKQANPMRGAPGGGAEAAPASDGTVEPQLTDRTDEQGRFTIENVPPGSTYSVLVWFAQGYRGYAQQDDSAIKRAVATGSRDVELTLKKMAEGEAPFPMGPVGPRPAGTAAPGMGGGRTPVPPAPAGPGTGGGAPPVPGMN